MDDNEKVLSQTMAEFSAYVKQHDFLLLMAELLEQCFLSKTDDPKQFIVDYLTRYIAHQKEFDQSNVQEEFHQFLDNDNQGTNDVPLSLDSNLAAASSLRHSASDNASAASLRRPSVFITEENYETRREGECEGSAVDEALQFEGTEEEHNEAENIQRFSSEHNNTTTITSDSVAGTDTSMPRQQTVETSFTAVSSGSSNNFVCGLALSSSAELHSHESTSNTYRESLNEASILDVISVSSVSQPTSYNQSSSEESYEKKTSPLVTILSSEDPGEQSGKDVWKTYLNLEDTRGPRDETEASFCSKFEETYTSNEASSATTSSDFCNKSSWKMTKPKQRTMSFHPYLNHREWLETASSQSDRENPNQARHVIKTWSQSKLGYGNSLLMPEDNAGEGRGQGTFLKKSMSASELTAATTSRHASIKATGSELDSEIYKNKSKISNSTDVTSNQQIRSRRMTFVEEMGDLISAVICQPAAVKNVHPQSAAESSKNSEMRHQEPPKQLHYNLRKKTLKKRRMKYVDDT